MDLMRAAARSVFPLFRSSRTGPALKTVSASVLCMGTVFKNAASHWEAAFLWLGCC